MKTCGETLGSIEHIRSVIAAPFGKLLCQSGAVVLQKPSLYACLVGLLFQASRDIGSDIDKVIKLKNDSPYIELDPESSKKGSVGDVQATVDCFIELLKVLEPLKTECETLTKKGEELFDKVNNDMMKWVDEFKAKSEDFMKLKEQMSKAMDNSKKIGMSLAVMKDIALLITSLVTDTATLINKFKDEKQRSELYEIAKKIKEDHKTDKEIQSNRKLYWKYTTDIKHGSWEDLKPIWRKITGEEYAEKGPFKVEKKT
jgi:hypothetical protein